MNTKKLIILFLLTLTIFSPQFVYAQLDPRCWTEKLCSEKRKGDNVIGSLDEEELADGFVQTSDSFKLCGKEDAAKQQLGFCLPVSQTATKISFGGKKKYLHIGEYIQTLYQYGIIAAGILAVLMIIAAGFIWITSGGNSERISSAKKKIGGALMGLFLAIFSYALLDLLNPALVNIRLPQIWSINTQGLSPPWCGDVEGDKKVFLLGPSNMEESARETEKEKLSGGTDYNVDPKKAICGNDYFVEGTGGLSCSGEFCKDKQSCFKSVAKENTECVDARITGTIVNSAYVDTMVAQDDGFITSVGADLLTEFWAWDWVEEIHIATVCKDGEPDEQQRGTIRSYRENELTQEFFIDYTDEDVQEWAKECGEKNDLRGFVLWTELNVSNSIDHEVHLIGRANIDMCDMNLKLEVEMEGDCERTLGPESNISHSSFFTKQELLDGLRLRIDAGAIPFIKNDDDRREQHYKRYGWSS